MGWLFPYGASRADVIADVTRTHTWRGNLGEANECRTIAKCIRGQNLWTVKELRAGNAKTASTDRFICLYLLRKDDGGWGYKDIEASMGPCEVNCPLSYLDLAGDPSNDYEKTWREHVRAYHAKRKAQRTPTRSKSTPEQRRVFREECLS